MELMVVRTRARHRAVIEVEERGMSDKPYHVDDEGRLVLHSDEMELGRPYAIASPHDPFWWIACRMPDGIRLIAHEAGMLGGDAGPSSAIALD